MRVFLDTNVLASAVATRGICADVLNVILAEHELVVGEAVLAELERVLMRKFRTSEALAREADAFLRQESEVIGDASALRLAIRDEDDVVILEQAVAGDSAVLVTGDRDLLEMDSPPILIPSPRGFWDHLRVESGGQK